MTYCQLPGAWMFVPADSSADVAGKEVVISRRAAEAVLRGSHVFVPGVLQNTAHSRMLNKPLNSCLSS